MLQKNPRSEKAGQGRVDRVHQRELGSLGSLPCLISPHLDLTLRLCLVSFFGLDGLRQGLRCIAYVA